MLRGLMIILLLLLLALFPGCASAQPAVGSEVPYGVIGGLDARAFKTIPEDAGSHVYLYQRLYPAKYNIPAPSGAYRLRLHFAQHSRDGKPDNNGYITVKAEGEEILEKFPTFNFKTRDRDQMIPVVLDFPVEVQDGLLTLTFPYEKVETPSLCGIELLGVSSDFATRINCGARKVYTDSKGHTWLPGREWPIPVAVSTRLDPVETTGRWVNVSDDILEKLLSINVAPRPRWYINSRNGMGIVALFVDRAGNHYANILGNGIWKLNVETGDFRRIDGGKFASQINSRTANNGNAGKYIQLVMNPHGAGFAPISWSSFKNATAQVVCPDGESFINFWQPNDCWDFGTVDWTENPPKLFFIVHHHSKGETWLSTDGGKTFEILFDHGSRVQALGTIGPNILIKALSREYKAGEYVDNPEADTQLVGIHRSRDLGKTWEKVSDIELRDWKGSMVYYNGDAWFNTPDGLALSEDQGKTWRIVEHSPTFTQPVVYGKNDNEMMGVNESGFFFSEDTGRSWEKILEAPETTGYYFWDPTRDIFYAGQYNGQWFRYNMEQSSDNE